MTTVCKNCGGSINAATWTKPGAKSPKLCAWVETNNEETWTFYRLPLAHHNHLKSTNMLEHFNQ